MCVHTHVDKYVDACMYINMHTYKHIRVYDMYKPVCTHIHVHEDIYVYEYIYSIYIYIYTCMYRGLTNQQHHIEVYLSYLIRILF